MSLLTDRARLLLNLKEFLVWIQVYIQFFAKVLSHCKRRSKGKKRAESLHSSMLLQNSKKKKRVESLHSLRPFNHKFTDFLFIYSSRHFYYDGIDQRWPFFKLCWKLFNYQRMGNVDQSTIHIPNVLVPFPHHHLIVHLITLFLALK